ncbi:hypothetical protein OZX69_04980 [Lactobacillus sp. ESL0731]|uniref:hypothetical protein n=1 Tax=unclassified Lactobacillus TaxID=2620435 RepID=UPI0023F70C9B|nr:MULTISPECIES: hypothetical protein [unclassified Lactobacillus]WEV50318.1 hypothetical protein OZX63_04975 [Lactobacillus sp. ESL0700]WEV61447.1 hypothetical protein OZX69_04980 [Lactobacillus sp. ESL0731]
MTSFGQLFEELFRSKSKKLLQIIVIQLIAAAILAGVMTFRAIAIHGDPFFTTFHSFLFNLTRVVMWTGFIVVLGSLIGTVSDTEKINRSQTWRLVPTTENNIYLSNVASSLAAFAILVLLEFVCGIGPVLLQYLVSGQRSLLVSFFSDMAKLGWLKWLQIIAVLILIVLAIYFTVSFLNFSSQTIVDFLPHLSGKLTLTIVRVIIILLICWLGVSATNTLLPIFKLPFELMYVGAAKLKLLSSISILVIFNIFVGAIDLLLINKSFEAKQNK